MIQIVQSIMSQRIQQRANTFSVHSVKYKCDGPWCRHQSGLSQLEREAAMREGALKAKADEVASLTEANRAAQANINQYVMDLQVSVAGLVSRVNPSCTVGMWLLG